MKDGQSDQSLALLPRLRRNVRAYIGSRVTDDHLADDLTQEVLRRALGQLHTLRNPLLLEPWILRIARNILIDHLRSPQRREVPLLSEPEDSEGPARFADLLAREEDQLRAQLHAYLRAVVAGLPQIHREALELTEWEGLSQVELARQLGVSVSTAKSRVQRGRQELRRQLERCCQFEADCYGRVVDVRRRPAKKS